MVSENSSDSAIDCVDDFGGDLAEGDFDRHAGLDADQQQVECVGKGALDRELALADGVLQEQHRRLQPEIGGADADAELDRQRLVHLRDHEHVESRADKQHDRRHRAGKQERDVGRVAAIAGHDQLVARGFLRQPFGQVEIFHHLGNELFRGLPQRHLFRLGEAVALALPEPFALAGNRLHALGEAFAGKQRHDQRIGGRARRDSGKQHGHEPRVVHLGDQKINHGCTVRSRS